MVSLDKVEKMEDEKILDFEKVKNERTFFLEKMKNERNIDFETMWRNKPKITRPANITKLIGKQY